MAFLNTSEFLAPTGVGLFGTGYSDMDWSVRRVGSTIANIAGWIPVVSIFASIHSFIQGGRSARRQPYEATAYISRGLLQLLQVGIILAPFDIGISLARAVRRHMGFEHGLA